jgi:internalin A
LLALSNLRRSDMPGWRRRSILIAALVLAMAATARAQASERAVAEWVIRLGGSITPEGRAEPIRELEELPPGDFQIVGIDLTGTLVVPEDLHHLSGLRRLKELFLPGPMWNEGAGSKRDSNDALAHLNTLLSLEKLHFSLHFLTNVNIQDKGLARLDSLTQLKELRLAQSKVTGSSLAPFVNLRSLDLSYSQVNDEGLQSLEGMKNLQRLLLQDTLVTDAGLRHLKDLTRLEELDLHGCRISGAGLAHLRGLTQLRKLNLLGATITDEGLDALSAMRGLQELNLYRSRVTNAGIQKLEAKKRLLSVDLRYTRVTRSGVDALRAALPECHILDSAGQPAGPAAGVSKAPGKGDKGIADWVRRLGGTVQMSDGRVVSLSLAATAVTDSQLQALDGLSQLRNLDLEGTEIGDLAFRFVGKITRLEQLNLSHTSVSDAGLANFPKALRSLKLSHTSVRGVALGGLTTLEELDLSGAPVNDESAKQLAQLVNLRSLRLSYTDLTDAGYAGLKSLSRLERLDLAGTDVGDKGLAEISSIASLTELNLSYGRLTDKGMDQLKSLQNLTRLEVARTRVTDAGIASLKDLKNLAVLNLDDTKVTDKSLEVLKSLRLQDLRLDGATITDAGVETLCAMTSLKSLNLYHTLVSEKAYQRLRQALPECQIIYDRNSALPARRRG